MKSVYRWVAVVLLAACLPLAACKQATVAPAEEESGQAKVEHLDGDQPARVTLSQEAATRLDIHTAIIREIQIEGAVRRVIPYAAILYDTEGDTWTYTNPAPLVFLRWHIKVDRIDGDLAILAEGPSSGVAVVTIGAAELYGSENEFEEE